MSESANTGLSSGQVEAFHRDGVLVVRNFLSDDDLAELRAAAEFTIDAGVDRRGEHHSYRRIGDRDEYFRTDRVWDYHAAFRTITVNPKLLAIVGQLIGHPFMPVNDSMVAKLPGSGVPIAWHQDPPYGMRQPPWREETHPIPNFDIDLYLDRADVESGCLYALPGHHLVGHVELAACSEDELFELAEPVELDAGDLLIHAMSAPHGSRANLATAPRRVLYLHYMAEEILRELHPHQLTREPFEDSGFTRVREWMVEADLSEADLAAHDVEFTRSGFTYRGDVTTPPRWWSHLIADLSDSDRESLRHPATGDR